MFCFCKHWAASVVWGIQFNKERIIYLGNNRMTKESRDNCKLHKFICIIISWWYNISFLSVKDFKFTLIVSKIEKLLLLQHLLASSPEWQAYVNTFSTRVEEGYQFSYHLLFLLQLDSLRTVSIAWSVILTVNFMYIHWNIMILRNVLWHTFRGHREWLY